MDDVSFIWLNASRRPILQSCLRQMRQRIRRGRHHSFAAGPEASC